MDVDKLNQIQIRKINLECSTQDPKTKLLKSYVGQKNDIHLSPCLHSGGLQLQLCGQD